jgi:sporulation protein YqfC
LITNTGKSVGITEDEHSSSPRLASDETVDENTVKRTVKIRHVIAAIGTDFFVVTNCSHSPRIFFNTIFWGKEKNDVGRIRKLLSGVTELPASAFGELPYIEFEIDNTLKLDGCREILGYNDREVRLMTDVGTVTVGGADIELCSYGNSTVRLVGRIKSISIEEVKDKC